MAKTNKELVAAYHVRRRERLAAMEKEVDELRLKVAAEQAINNELRQQILRLEDRLSQ